MRIIGGEYRSRIIQMPKSAQARPTQDKVRQAIFNILGDISGASVLDLFAGSGAFGLEALSRGAARAVFIENNPKCVSTIEANIKSLAIPKDRYNIMNVNALNAFPLLGKGADRYDLVFMDPPYYKDMAKKCLISLDSCDILSQFAFIVVERFKSDLLDNDLKGLALYKEKRYGDTVISIFRKI
jgi:16S rRNA (guanine966-N2)-methyltransferase